MFQELDWRNHGGSTVTAGHNVEFLNYVNNVFIANGYDILSLEWNSCAFTTYANLPVTEQHLDSAAAAVACTFDNTGAAEDIVLKMLTDFQMATELDFQAGVLPAGLNSSTTYYVVEKILISFKVSLTLVKQQSICKMMVLVQQHIVSLIFSLYYFLKTDTMANTDNYPTRVYFSDQLATTIESTSYFDIDAPVTGLIYIRIIYLFIPHLEKSIKWIVSFCFWSNTARK